MGNSGEVPSLQMALVTRAIDMVRNGQLPHEASAHLLAGPGQRNRCALCDEAIAPSDVEYEVTSAPADGAPRSFCFHIPCYHTWKQACLAVPPAPDEGAVGR